MFNNLSKEEAIGGLLDTTEKITSNWLRANPDCRQTEPVYFYWAKNSVQYSHNLDKAISDLDDEDNRYQVLLLSPDKTNCLAKLVLKNKAENWQAKVYC